MYHLHHYNICEETPLQKSARMLTQELLGDSELLLCVIRLLTEDAKSDKMNRRLLAKITLSSGSLSV